MDDKPFSVTERAFVVISIITIIIDIVVHVDCANNGSLLPLSVPRRQSRMNHLDLLDTGWSLLAWNENLFLCNDVNKDLKQTA